MLCGELSISVKKYLFESTHLQGAVIPNGFPHLGPKDPGDPREHLLREIVRVQLKYIERAKTKNPN